MDRHIWLTMEDNENVTDGQTGNYWPDVFTFPINRFIYTKTPEVITLDENQIDRLDLLMYDYYGVAYYDDIVLWLNNVEYKHELESGQKFLMPDKTDLERFFLRYTV